MNNNKNIIIKINRHGTDMFRTKTKFQGHLISVCVPKYKTVRGSCVVLLYEIRHKHNKIKVFNDVNNVRGKPSCERS